MTLHLVDVARWQAGLDLGDVVAAGFHAVNIKVSGGTSYTYPDAPAWARQARQLGLGICTFHWLDNSAPGDVQARYAYDRIVALGGPAGMAHQVDCESDATEPVWRAYVTTMQALLGRPVVSYTGDWWWTTPGRRWSGADLTPYLWAAPNAGYLGVYPGDASPHWAAGYGGWPELAVMQYAVAPLPGGSIRVSMSAIRNRSVWAALTGGPVAWYLNPALTRFRAEVNDRWPARDKASDGTIGDQAHAATSSDHNPDPAGQPNPGSVDAWDMDVDGVDVAECIRAFQAHEASAYWIYNDRICFRSEGWAPRSYAYAGPNRNRHTQHVHFNTREAYENSTRPWGIKEDDVSTADVIAAMKTAEVKAELDAAALRALVSGLVQAAARDTPAGRQLGSAFNKLLAPVLTAALGADDGAAVIARIEQSEAGIFRALGELPNAVRDALSKEVDPATLALIERAINDNIRRIRLTVADDQPAG